MTDRDLCKGLFDFIEESPSCFHVIANLKASLEAAGFTGLLESEEWSLVAGGSYYVTRNDSSVIAFRIPKNVVKGFHMVAAHSDSPTFKVKEHPEKETEKHYVSLNIEKYGGMILSTWLDRPLSVAGRVVVVGENGAVETRLVNVDKDLCVIPSLAIHMNPEANKGMEFNPQVDMLPLFDDCSDGRDGKDSLLAEVAVAAGVKSEDILGHDLFLYVRDKGRFVGRDGAFILAPKLDDLQCVYAAAKALVNSVLSEDYVSVCAVFDNEEVGSGTKQGADSTFLEDVLERICAGLPDEGVQGSRQHLLKRLLADSFLISADNAHGVHPNHPEKADPTNRPYLNQGLVIKYHGSQKYTTDAVSAAKMKMLCTKAGVPWQTYANRSDIAGGSTLGNISTAHVSVPSVDVGLPQLAMHSAVETAGSKDLAYAVKVFEQFYSE